MMHEAVLRSDRYRAHVIGALAHADVLFSLVIIYNVLISMCLPHYSWPIWCDITISQESQFLLDHNYGLHYTPLRIPTEVMLPLTVCSDECFLVLKFKHIKFDF